MISPSDDLYRQLILDHNRRPRNRRRLENADRVARGHNPLCGDVVRVFLKIEDDVITDVAFEGQGCAISTASASLMSEAVKGKRLDQAEALFKRFHSLVTGKGNGDGEDGGLGKLNVFAGVSGYPARVKCATLAWHTLDAALKGRNEEVSTE